MSIFLKILPDIQILMITSESPGKGFNEAARLKTTSLKPT